MTPRDAILARLGRSPATMAELYDSMLRFTDTPPGEAYAVAMQSTAGLMASGDVELLKEISVYRLTTKQIPNNTKDNQ